MGAMLAPIDHSSNFVPAKYRLLVNVRENDVLESYAPLCEECARTRAIGIASTSGTGASSTRIISQIFYPDEFEKRSIDSCPTNT